MTASELIKRLENLIFEFEEDNNNAVVGNILIIGNTLYEWNGESLEKLPTGISITKVID